MPAMPAALGAAIAVIFLSAIGLLAVVAVALAAFALSAYMRLWRSPAPLIHKLNMTLLRATASVAIVLAAAALGIGAGAVILFVMG